MGTTILPLSFVTAYIIIPAIIKNGRLIASGKMEDITKNHNLEDVFLELTDHE